MVPQKITALPGEPVTIPLGIHGFRGHQLEFLIRSRPQRGKLGPVVSTGANSATVTYTAGANAAEGGEDRFTFAVKSNEGVSAPGLVTVTIGNRPVLPQRIVVPPHLDFPTVLLGQRSTTELEISNRGGGMIEGMVTVQEPWSIRGSAEYRLGPGSTTTLTLVFQPTKAGNITGQAVLGPDPRQVVGLSGTGETPLMVMPERLLLQPKPGSQTRMATLTIENRAEDPVEVIMESGERLMIDKTAQVPGKAKVQVPVFAEAAHPARFDEKLRLRVGDWRVEVPVEAEPLPPMLKLVAGGTPTTSAMAGQPVELRAVVEHHGGVAAQVHVGVSPPFEVSERSFELATGGKKGVRISAPSLSAGPHTAVLTATALGINQRLELAVDVAEAKPAPTASVAPEARKPVRATTAETATVPALGNAAANTEFGDARDLQSSTVNWANQVGRQEFPNGMGNFVRDLTPQSAALEWPAELGSTMNLSLEERHYTLGAGGQLAVNWIPLPGITFKTGKNPVRAEMPRLEADRVYIVRVRSGADTLFTSQFKTPVKPPFIAIGWQAMTISALLIALVAVGWIRWKRRSRTNW